MGEPTFTPTISGQGIQLTDHATLGAVAGLADDRVFAELLRLGQLGINGPSRAAIPYSTQQQSGIAPSNAPIVQPSGHTDGSVFLFPFRAIVGPRNASNAAPSPNPAGVWGQTNDMASWRDVRSGVYAQTSNGYGFPLITSVGFAANASGNPRWDLVWAAIQVNANGPVVTRRIKSPSSGVLTATAIPQYLNSPVSIGVTAGTPGATPTPPLLPADSAGFYYVPLAWVRIPNGFVTGLSTIAPKDIRSTVTAANVGGGGATNSRFRNLSEPFQVEPATGNNDASGTTLAAYPWNASAGGRPICFMPPDMIGGRQIIIEVNAKSAPPSHGSTSVVDASIDWRNRFTLCHAQFNTGAGSFANDGGDFPSNLGAGGGFRQMGNTLTADSSLVGGAPTVFYASSVAQPGFIASGAVCGLYLDNTGILRWYANGTSPQVHAFFWLMASGQFPNV